MSLEIDIRTLNEKRLKQPYRLWMWLAENRKDVYFYATCHYAGTVFLAGETYQAIAFETSNYDGLFKESGIGMIWSKMGD